jgi:hypothetical protein
MTGTASQIEWAEQIKPRVNAEFDRVAAAFRQAGAKHSGAAIVILEDKRAEVMSNPRAGYFIREWQEITDQVQRMILQDPRYQQIKPNQAAR